jgi:hypothetical protein
MEVRFTRYRILRVHRRPHRTLENFDTQKDLSRRQLRWQEFLSQYDMSITYIRGEDNTVADALSRLPPNCFPDEIEDPPVRQYRTPLAPS